MPPRDRGRRLPRRGDERLPSGTLRRGISGQRDTRAQADRRASSSAGITVAGVCIVGGALTPPRACRRRAGSADAHRDVERHRSVPGVILDDAPCGVAESSPVEFNDGGTPAVEVGDRQGDLYGLNLAERRGPCRDGATARAAASARDRAAEQPPAATPGDRRRSGSRCPGARRSTRPPRSEPTATCTSAPATRRRRSTAATTRTGRTGPRLWNQVVTNPSTDTVPDGGVQASLSIGQRRVAGRGRLARPGDLRAQQRRTAPGHRLAAVLRRQRVLHRGRRATSTARARTTSSRRRLVAGLRLREALRQRRSRPDLQRPRRAGLQRQHRRGGRLLPRRRPHPARRRATGSPPGTGSFYGGSDEDTVKVFDTKCNQVWSDKLDGIDRGQPRPGRRAGQRPARRGRGHRHGCLHAARCGRSTPPPAPSSGSTSVPGAVLGSVTTADLTGSGRAGRHRADRPRPLHPRRPDGHDGGPRRRRFGQRRHLTRRAGPTASRTPRW